MTSNESPAREHVVDPAGGGDARPSRARLVVLFFLCSMAFVLYLDRVCISQAVNDIQRDLKIENRHMGWVLAAFTLAYGLFEVPTGYWGDRYGSRRILTRIVIWWSAFTALTSACTGLYSLIVVRFLFGAGEAGAYPNAARVITRWFPAVERGRVQGLFMAASLLGGTFSPIVASEMIAAFGWRWTFVLFGAFGIVWAAIFFWWFRDDPAEHWQVNPAEAALLAADSTARPRGHIKIPWGEVARNPAIWLLGTVVSCTAFNSYFYFSWYPKYLQDGRGVEALSSGRMAGLVLGCGAAGNLLGGVLGDRLKRRFTSMVRVRRRLAAACLSVAGALLVASVYADRPWVASGTAAASCFILFLQQSTWWSCVAEVSGRYIGSLFGLMNGLGVFGAMGSQFFFGYFADWQKSRGLSGREQYDPAFFVFAGVLLFGAVCWQWIDSTRTVQGEPEEAGETAGA